MDSLLPLQDFSRLRVYLFQRLVRGSGMARPKLVGTRVGKRPARMLKRTPSKVSPIRATTI